MSATYASDWAALIGPKPGKPGVFTNWPSISLPLRSVRFPPELNTGYVWWLTTRSPLGPAAAFSCGWRYFAPNTPWKPLYPPGSSGSESATAVLDGLVCPYLTARAVEQN